MTESETMRIRADFDRGVGMRKMVIAVVFAGCCLVPDTFAQTAPLVSGKDVWNALAKPGMDPERSAQVKNVQIKRDQLTITLIDGVIQFAKEANGVVFGAVFHGNGRAQVHPPNSIEAQQLRLFTKQDELDMNFTGATFSFTDGLFDEIARQVKWQASGPSSDDLYAKRQQEREDLGAQCLPRLFKSVLSPDRRRTAFFVADLLTKEKDWVEFLDDAMQQEEIIVGRWSTMGTGKHFDVWTEFPSGTRDPRHAYDNPLARQDFVVLAYQIDAEVEENADLSAMASLTVQPRFSGERAFLFHLDSNLRVDFIKDEQGRALEFVQAQEKRDRAQSYGDYVTLVLADPTVANVIQKLQFHYAGKRAIRKVGDGNFYSDNFGWYPTIIEQDTPRQAFRSKFELTLRTPKQYLLVATGRKVRESDEGRKRITTWSSDVPASSAGFAFGDDKFYAERVGDTEIQVYANNQPDDMLKSIMQNYRDPLAEPGSYDPATGARSAPVSRGASPTLAASIGVLAPAAMAKRIGTETSNTVRVFEDYFGPYPYQQLAVTDISAPGHGQDWPGLLFLGWLTFLDSTERKAFGINSRRDQADISDVFRAHESAHQWWGQRVGWKGYHDVWLSEGFAQFSGNLYVRVREGLKESTDRWRVEKENLSRVDSNNRKIESLGPISLGWRIASSETDNRSFHNVIYSKGAFVLHMLQMQLYDIRSQDPDHVFKEMMQDYCKTFDNKPASTEDFKAVVERHMTAPMDLGGTHKMDWFFDQYVYGTGIPVYTFRYSVENTPDGKKHLKGTITRSGVAESWKDDLVLYGHAGDNSYRLGIIGATHPQENVDAVLPAKLDRFSINDEEDTLAEVHQ
jgi:hypothetical protein